MVCRITVGSRPARWAIVVGSVGAGAGSPADSAVARWVVARAAMEMMVSRTSDPMPGNETADRYGQYPPPRAYSWRRSPPTASAGQPAGARSCMTRARKGPTVRGPGRPGRGPRGGDGGEQHLVGVLARAGFLGELGLLSGQGRSWPRWCWSRGEVLVVPPERVRAVLAPSHSGTWCCGPISCAAPCDRGRGEMGIVGSRSVTDARRLRGFAARNRLRQRWIDLAMTGGPRRRCANSASRPSRPWWCCGAASQGRATRATPKLARMIVAGAELGRDRL